MTVDRDSRIKLLRILRAMKCRCYSASSGSYRYYGARGIRIHQLWLDDPMLFVEWAVQSGYQDGLTIDRVDGDGSYSPDNCRWASRSVQQQNRKQWGKGSRFYGVTRTNSGGFRAAIRKGSVRRRSRVFCNEADAAMAYDSMAVELYGSDARLNFQKEACP